jgi:hypothetical protein
VNTALAMQGELAVPGMCEKVEAVLPSGLVHCAEIRLVRPCGPGSYTSRHVSPMKVVGPNKYVLVRIDYRAAQRGAGTRVSAQQIVEGFGRTAAECIAFGSGAQSVDMLRWAGCGVSMGGVEVPSVTAAAADVATLGVPGVSIYDALHFG